MVWGVVVRISDGWECMDAVNNVWCMLEVANKGNNETERYHDGARSREWCTPVSGQAGLNSLGGLARCSQSSRYHLNHKPTTVYTHGSGPSHTNERLSSNDGSIRCRAKQLMSTTKLHVPWCRAWLHRWRSQGGGGGVLLRRQYVPLSVMRGFCQLAGKEMDI